MNQGYNDFRASGKDSVKLKLLVRRRVLEVVPVFERQRSVSGEPPTYESKEFHYLRWQKRLLYQLDAVRGVAEV